LFSFLLDVRIGAGKGVTFYGSVSDGMGFDVAVDGSTATGAARGSSLATISGLDQGNHTVMLTAKSSGQNAGSLFTFSSAVVTVGTGLTGYALLSALHDP
jgi:hypothetical protein